MKTTRRALVLIAAAAVAVIGGSLAYSHCQIPCGIYDDEGRFTELAEHFTTIEKSMKLVNELSADPKANANQLVRWVMNKEAHADKAAEIITYYFMTQRIVPAAPTDKAAYDDYVKKLTGLHEMLVYTMKAKQTTDPANVEKLRELLHEFHHAYNAKKN